MRNAECGMMKIKDVRRYECTKGRGSVGYRRVHAYTRTILASTSDQWQGERALIVGTGDAGELLIREIERTPGLPCSIIGFVVEVARGTV